MLSDEKIKELAQAVQDGICPHDDTLAFARAIEAAVLAEQEKAGPVAWMKRDEETGAFGYFHKNRPEGCVPLYLHPAPAPEGMAKQCEWRHCGDEYMPGTWDGECGAKWTFTEDGPVENNMRFCPECGGEVVIAATEKEAGK